MRDAAFEDVLASLIVLAWVVEARDPYTGGHLWRVASYSRLLAQAAELSPAEVARIEVGALVHDLGKVGIPDAILCKPDRLTESEWAVMRTHPEIGARMLSGHPLGALVRDVVLWHHERVDGTGYPAGLRGHAFPTAARIVGVADAFDAMTSRRPFRDGMSIARALELMDRDAGTQFDARLLRLFHEIERTGVCAHVHGHADEGIPLQSCPTCGPTLVLRREQVAGESTFCRNCSMAFELVECGAQLVATPTGERGTADDLAPRPDDALIGRLVRESVRRLPVNELQARTRASG